MAEDEFLFHNFQRNDHPEIEWSHAPQEVRDLIAQMNAGASAHFPGRVEISDSFDEFHNAVSILRFYDSRGRAAVARPDLNYRLYYNPQYDAVAVNAIGSDTFKFFVGSTQMAAQGEDRRVVGDVIARRKNIEQFLREPRSTFRGTPSPGMSERLRSISVNELTPNMLREMQGAYLLPQNVEYLDSEGKPRTMGLVDADRQAIMERLRAETGRPDYAFRKNEAFLLTNYFSAGGLGIGLNSTKDQRRYFREYNRVTDLTGEPRPMESSFMFWSGGEPMAGTRMKSMFIDAPELFSEGGAFTLAGKAWIQKTTQYNIPNSLEMSREAVEEMGFRVGNIYGEHYPGKLPSGASFVSGVQSLGDFQFGNQELTAINGLVFHKNAGWSAMIDALNPFETSEAKTLPGTKRQLQGVTEANPLMQAARSVLGEFPSILSAAPQKPERLLSIALGTFAAHEEGSTGALRDFVRAAGAMGISQDDALKMVKQHAPASGMIGGDEQARLEFLQGDDRAPFVFARAALGYLQDRSGTMPVTSHVSSWMLNQMRGQMGEDAFRQRFGEVDSLSGPSAEVTENVFYFAADILEAPHIMRTTGKTQIGAHRLNLLSRSQPAAYEELLSRDQRGEFNNPARRFMRAALSNFGMPIDNPVMDVEDEYDLGTLRNRALTAVEGDTSRHRQEMLNILARENPNRYLRIRGVTLPTAKDLVGASRDVEWGEDGRPEKSSVGTLAAQLFDEIGQNPESGSIFNLASQLETNLTAYASQRSVQRKAKSLGMRAFTGAAQATQLLPVGYAMANEEDMLHYIMTAKSSKEEKVDALRRFRQTGEMVGGLSMPQGNEYLATGMLHILTREKAQERFPGLDSYSVARNRILLSQWDVSRVNKDLDSDLATVEPYLLDPSRVDWSRNEDMFLGAGAETSGLLSKIGAAGKVQHLLTKNPSRFLADEIKFKSIPGYIRDFNATSRAGDEMAATHPAFIEAMGAMAAQMGSSLGGEMTPFLRAIGAIGEQPYQSAMDLSVSQSPATQWIRDYYQKFSIANPKIKEGRALSVFKGVQPGSPEEAFYGSGVLTNDFATLGMRLFDRSIHLEMQPTGDPEKDQQLYEGKDHAEGYASYLAHALVRMGDVGNEERVSSVKQALLANFAAQGGVDAGLMKNPKGMVTVLQAITGKTYDEKAVQQFMGLAGQKNLVGYQGTPTYRRGMNPLVDDIAETWLGIPADRNAEPRRGNTSFLGTYLTGVGASNTQWNYHEQPETIFPSILQAGRLMNRIRTGISFRKGNGGLEANQHQIRELLSNRINAMPGDTYMAEQLTRAEGLTEVDEEFTTALLESAKDTTTGAIVPYASGRDAWTSTSGAVEGPALPPRSRYRSFSKGGYTGEGAASQPAGVVHAGEYVLTKKDVQLIKDGKSHVVMAKVERDLSSRVPASQANLLNNVPLLAPDGLPGYAIGGFVSQNARDFAAANGIDIDDVIAGTKAGTTVASVKAYMNARGMGTAPSGLPYGAYKGGAPPASSGMVRTGKINSSFTNMGDAGALNDPAFISFENEGTTLSYRLDDLSLPQQNELMEQHISRLNRGAGEAGLNLLNDASFGRILGRATTKAGDFLALSVDQRRSLNPEDEAANLRALGILEEAQTAYTQVSKAKGAQNVAPAVSWQFDRVGEVLGTAAQQRVTGTSREQYVQELVKGDATAASGMTSQANERLAVEREMYGDLAARDAAGAERLGRIKREAEVEQHREPGRRRGQGRITALEGLLSVGSPVDLINDMALVNSYDSTRSYTQDELRDLGLAHQRVSAVDAQAKELSQLKPDSSVLPSATFAKQIAGTLTFAKQAGVGTKTAYAIQMEDAKASDREAVRAGREIEKLGASREDADFAEVSGMSKFVAKLGEVSAMVDKVNTGHDAYIKNARQTLDIYDTLAKTVDKADKALGLAGGDRAKLTDEDRRVLDRADGGLRDQLRDAAPEISRLRQEVIKQGINQNLSVYGSEDDRQLMLTQTLLRGGRRGSILRDSLPDEYYGGEAGSEGLETGLGFNVKGKGAIQAVGAATRFADRLYGGLRAVQRVGWQVLDPMIGFVDQYQQQQSQLAQAEASSGAIDYNQMMSGQYGNLRRRQGQQQLMTNEVGRQIYQSYAGLFANAGGQAAGQDLGALISIGGPALAASIGVTEMTANPFAGALVGGAVAAGAAVNYFSQSSQDVQGMAQTLDAERQRATTDAQRRANGQDVNSYFLGMNFGYRPGSGSIVGDITNTIAGLVNPDGLAAAKSASQFNFDVQDRLANGSRNGQTTEQFLRSMGVAHPSMTSTDIQGGYLNNLVNTNLARGIPQETTLSTYAWQQVYGENAGMTAFMDEFAARGLGDASQLYSGMASSMGIAAGDQAGQLALAGQINSQIGNQPTSQQPLEVARLQEGASRFSQLNQLRRRAGVPILGASDFGTGGIFPNDTGKQDLWMQADAQFRQAQISDPNFARQLQGGGTTTRPDYVSHITSALFADNYLTANNQLNSYDRAAAYSMQLSAFSSFGQTTQDQLVNQYRGQDAQRRTRIDQFMAGNPYVQTMMRGSTDATYNRVDLQTGFDPYTFNVNGLEYGQMQKAAGMFSMGNLLGSAADVAGGSASIQFQLLQNQMTSQALGINQQRMNYYTNRQATTGGALGVNGQGFAVGGDRLQGLQQFFNGQGFAFNTGNGMGQWQIEDASTGIQRAQQDWGLQMQGQQLGISRAGYDLAGRQFAENYGLRQQQFQVGTQYQRTEMGIGQQHTMTQMGWQMEDLQFGRAVMDVQYGWQQEDYSRNIRYARGREKRDLMREQQRSTVSYAMQAGHEDVQEGRLTEQTQWTKEEFDRKKQYFEQTTQFQKQEMELSKQHFDQNRQLENQRMQMNELNFQKEKQWLTENRQLEDQNRLLQRQFWDVQSQMNQRFTVEQQTLQLSATNLNNQLSIMNLAMQVSANQAELNRQTGVALLDSLGGGLVNIANQLMSAFGFSGNPGNVGSGGSGGGGTSGGGGGGTHPLPPVTSTPGAGPGGLPPVTGTGAGGGGRPVRSPDAVGYLWGGSTGYGPVGAVAGVVHTREHVVPEGGSLVLRGGETPELAARLDKVIYWLEKIAANPTKFNVNVDAPLPPALDYKAQSRARL